jgi:pyruvate/2-oxoglutarate dehydrogenase complex dihydrolipoamide acyltransferase (E2) component
MGIFSAIKKAVFGDNGPLGGQFGGRKDHPQTTAGESHAPAASPQARPTPPQAPAQAPASATTGAPAAPAPAPAQAPAQAPVDVEQVLEQRAQSAGQPLNWRTSIVDLMKLLHLDPSLANRKELAEELGYTGAKDGSAEMNTWLIKAVMRELEKNGGTVPASLKD